MPSLCVVPSFLFRFTVARNGFDHRFIGHNLHSKLQNRGAFILHYRFYRLSYHHEPFEQSSKLCYLRRDPSFWKCASCFASLYFHILLQSSQAMDAAVICCYCSREYWFETDRISKVSIKEGINNRKHSGKNWPKFWFPTEVVRLPWNLV